MAIFFSGSELLDIALGIERNGLAFYQSLANKTKNQEAKVIYDYLVGEEKKTPHYVSRHPEYHWTVSAS